MASFQSSSHRKFLRILPQTRLFRFLGVAALPMPAEAAEKYEE